MPVDSKTILTYLHSYLERKDRILSSISLAPSVLLADEKLQSLSPLNVRIQVWFEFLEMVNINV